MEMQLDRLVLPVQQFASSMLNSFERGMTYQLGLAETYTQFTMNQWRDALEVQDARSLREFVEKRALAVQELNRQVVEEAEKLMHVGHDLTGAAERFAQRQLGNAAEVVQSAAAEAERAAAAAARGSRRA